MSEMVGWERWMGRREAEDVRWLIGGGPKATGEVEDMR